MKKMLVFRLPSRVNDEKLRSKVFKIVVSQPGVESAAITGEGNQLEVVGENIDSVALAKSLRKKLGHAHQMSIGPAGGGYKKDEKAGVDPGLRHAVPRIEDRSHGLRFADKRSCSVM